MLSDYGANLTQLGKLATESIFSVAELVKNESSVGLVAVAIGCVFLLSVVTFLSQSRRKTRAISRIHKAVNRASSRREFATEFDSIHRGISTEQKSRKLGTYDFNVRRAWDEYAETLVLPAEEDDGQPVCNTVRPNFFFNSHDLGFEYGVWRHLPGIFVSIGLLLTFFGIIAALGTLDNIDQNSMSAFLAAARGKFTMSLAGLLASILFTITYRFQSAIIEKKVARLCDDIEYRVRFQTPEQIAVDQLKATQEQTSQLKVLGNDMGVQIGDTVSKALTRDLGPVLDQIGNSAGTEVSGMVGQIGDALNAKLNDSLDEMSRTLSTINKTLVDVVDRLTSSGDNIGMEMAKSIENLHSVVEGARRQMETDEAAARNARAQEQETSHAAISSLLESIDVGMRDNNAKMTEASHSIIRAAEGLATSINATGKDVTNKAVETVADIGSNVNQKVADTGAELTRQLTGASSDFLESLSDFHKNLDTSLVEPIRSMALHLEASNRELEKHANSMNLSTAAQKETSSNLTASAKALETISQPIAESVERIERTNDAVRFTLESSLQAMEASRATVDATMDAMKTSIAQLKQVVENAEAIDDNLGEAFQLIEGNLIESQAQIRRFSEEVTNRFGDGIQSIQTVLDGIAEFEPASVGA